VAASPAAFDTGAGGVGVGIGDGVAGGLGEVVPHSSGIGAGHARGRTAAARTDGARTPDRCAGTTARAPAGRAKLASTTPHPATITPTRPIKVTLSELLPPGKQADP